MKIKAFHRYKTRNGEEARVYATDVPGKYPVLGVYKIDDGWAASSWTTGGGLLVGTEDLLDLIEELGPFFSFDKSCLPDEAQWIAMDKDGAWWWYESEPDFCKDGGMWCTRAGNCGHVPYEFAPSTFTGTWGESLMRVADL